MPIKVGQVQVAPEVEQDGVAVGAKQDNMIVEQKDVAEDINHDTAEGLCMMHHEDDLGVGI